MKETDLSIIIISFNTKELLGKCIGSVYATTKNIDYEIIVVDNASTDGSPEMVTATFPKVKVIVNKENLGFAKANNDAIKIANGKYFLLLNSDTFVKENAIETLVKFIDKSSKVDAVGPKVLNLNGTLQTKGGRHSSILSSLLFLMRIDKFIPRKIIYHFFHKYYWNENTTREVDWVYGCCLLIRKAAIDKVGLLSEDFFMYFEEMEWCYRAKQKKCEIWYVPDAEVTHLGASSPSENRMDIIISMRITFYKKTIGIFRGIVISMFSILSILITYLRAQIKPNLIAESNMIKIRLKLEIRTLIRLIGYKVIY